MCSVEERNNLLKQPILKPDDIAKLFDCKSDMAYRYIEVVNEWARQNGRVPYSCLGRKTRKAVRTIDYIEFAGLPRELML